MPSEVRKVLDSYSFFEIPLWLTRLDAAERADAAKREEPVQALRQAVAELIARWSGRYVHLDAVMMVRNIIAELNAIIATKPENQSASGDDPWRVTGVTPTKDGGSTVSFSYQKTDTSEPVLDGSTFHGPDEYMVTYQCPQCKKTGRCTNKSCPENCSCGHRFGESPKATASGPVKTRNFGDVIRKKLQENPELAEQVADEHIRSIAAEVVRDAMPDVLDAVAKTFREKGLVATEIAFREHAAKLRKERGA